MRTVPSISVAPIDGMMSILAIDDSGLSYNLTGLSVESIANNILTINGDLPSTLAANKALIVRIVAKVSISAEL